MVFEAVAKLIAERNDIDLEEITMDSTFKDLNFDSLDTTEMLLDLEDVLGYEIEIEDKVETVGELVKLIEAIEH